MSEQLQKLIEIALKDGVLSSQERQLLYTKAESLGISHDEVDMMLLSYAPGANSAAPTASDSKCPSCGAAGMGKERCNYCGYEVPRGESSANVKKLLQILAEIGQTKPDEYKESEMLRGFTQRTDGDSGLMGTIMSHSRMSSAGFQDQQRRENHLEEHKKRVQQMMITAIRDFPIPDGTDELRDFMREGVVRAREIKKGLFASFSEIEKEHNVLAPAWKMKCEQILEKVKLGNGRSILSELQNMYNQINKR